MEKTWTENQIIDLLNSNPKAVDRAVTTLFEKIEYVAEADRHILTHFYKYVNGLDARNQKRFKPKSLTNPHTKIFQKQGYIKNAAIEVGRDIAIRHASILAAIANGEELVKPLPERLYVRTVSEGRYKDTVELYAYRNDNLPEEKNDWPTKFKKLREADITDYADHCKAFQTPMVDESEFLSNYTIFERTSCYLD
jgi:hypothetical protein